MTERDIWQELWKQYPELSNLFTQYDELQRTMESQIRIPFKTDPQERRRKKIKYNLILNKNYRNAQADLARQIVEYCLQKMSEKKISRKELRNG